MPDPQKNVAFTYSFPVINSSNRPFFLVNPGIVSGDWKVSIDNSAFTNLSNIPTINPAGSRLVEIQLTSTEMDGDVIVVQGISSANTFDDIMIVIDTTTNTVDSGVALAANSIMDSTYNRIRGTVQSDAGNSATQFKTNLASSVDNFYNDMIVKFTSGALQGEVKFVTGYTGATNILYFVPGFTGTPANGDTFDLINF